MQFVITILHISLNSFFFSGIFIFFMFTFIIDMLISLS